MKSAIQFVQLDSLQGGQPLGPRGFDHPFFAWIGLRPPRAQHTLAEHEALKRHARNARTIVEIGVAEGASAAGLRQTMSPEGTLYLIDPFHLSRLPVLNFSKRAAHRAVGSAGTARTCWVESFSQDAVRSWSASIDFLLIDGDHREEAVERDWNDWSRFVAPSGLVAFHDARLFPSGWTTPGYGPVLFINRTFRQNPKQSDWLITEEVDSLVFVSRRTHAWHDHAGT